MNKVKFKYQKRFFLSCLLLVSSFTMKAQSVTNSAVSSLGFNQSKTSDFNLSYTVGQVAVKTLATGNTMLTQGLHQADYLFITGIFTERYTGAIKLKAYPNPFMNELALQVEELDNDDHIAYQLIDITGRVFIQDVLHSGQAAFEINTTTIPVGVYLLRITNNDQLVKTLQLHKLK